MAAVKLCMLEHALCGRSLTRRQPAAAAPRCLPPAAGRWNEEVVSRSGGAELQQHCFHAHQGPAHSAHKRRSAAAEQTATLPAQPYAALAPHPLRRQLQPTS